MKQIISDRNKFKLIDRICELRKKYPEMKVGPIDRPLCLGGFQDGVFEVEVEY
jgi:hypothetical protein